MLKVAIMITSCDAYKDCWRPMSFSLKKSWPDCKYPKYLITNHDVMELVDTTVIPIGDDGKSWCTLAKRGLEAIDCDCVIFFQDDYWLDKTVNNEAIKRHVEYFEQNNLDYLKLDKDFLRDEKRIENTDYCENPIDKRYTLNTAIAIWRKETMLKVLIEGWTGWDFERKIVPYLKENGINLNSQALHSSVLDEKGIYDIYEGAIYRGKWTNAAVEFLHVNGFDELITQRKQQGKLTTWISRHNPEPTSILRLPYWAALKILRDFNLNW